MTTLWRKDKRFSVPARSIFRTLIWTLSLEERARAMHNYAVLVRVWSGWPLSQFWCRKVLPLLGGAVWLAWDDYSNHPAEYSLSCPHLRTGLISRLTIAIIVLNSFLAAVGHFSNCLSKRCLLTSPLIPGTEIAGGLGQWRESLRELSGIWTRTLSQLTVRCPISLTTVRSALKGDERS